MSRIVTVILIYHRDKPVDSINLLRERREKFVGDDSERHYNGVWGRVKETIFSVLKFLRQCLLDRNGSIRVVFNRWNVININIEECGAQ
jgi:hypothetical protein